MTMKNPFLLTLFLFLTISLSAQKVSVGKVTENRSTEQEYFGNRCEIQLKVSGEEIRKYKYVKVSALNKAVDDQGIDMIDEEELDFDYEKIEDAVVELDLKLHTASRKASVIKELQGEVTLFNPTEANGAIVKVIGFQSKPNANLLPVKAPLKMVYLDKAAYEAFNKANKDKSEAELKKLPEATRVVAAMLLNAFESFSFMSESDPNSLSFLIDGDFTKLVDVKFEDETGKEVERNGTMTSGDNLVVYYFNQPPSPKWKMTVYVEAAAALKKMPFSFANVDLP